MRLHDLRATEGARREKRRIGRGHGSGQGTTAGKGTKGQKARTGGGVPPYFEGGQLPLVRRLPYRRGFKNPFRVEYAIVNVSQLAALPTGSTVTSDTLVQAGLLNRGEGPVKVLGDGALGVALHVQADRISRQARAKIEAAGGSATELNPRVIKEKKNRGKNKPKAAPAQAAQAQGGGGRRQQAAAEAAPAEGAPAAESAPAAGQAERPARRQRGDAPAEATAQTAPAAEAATEAPARDKTEATPEAAAPSDGAPAAEETRE
jgi:large subunit ribosomal protein L15